MPGQGTAQGGDTSNPQTFAAMNSAQLRLLNAQAENLEADAENKRGVERENKTADTKLKGSQTTVQDGIAKMQTIERDFAESTLEERVHMVIQEKNKLDALVEREGFDTRIKRDTWTQEKTKIEQEANEAILRNAVLEATKNKTIKETEHVEAKIKYMAHELTELQQRIQASKDQQETNRLQFALNWKIQTIS